MQDNKKKQASTKSKIHPRNKHRQGYNFKQLIKTCPALAPYVQENKYGTASIDFANAAAVQLLNKALLMEYYGIIAWQIPSNYLVPPIPSRADYIHHIADVLGDQKEQNIPRGPKIKCLDIGVGANCVYPIIGNKEYGWSFIGADIDAVAVQSAKGIIASNPSLKNTLEIRQQQNKKNIFQGIIQEEDVIDLTICNPPFHASAEEAQASSLRKLRNLKKEKVKEVRLNFGGQSNELWYEGGEVAFIKKMIKESKQFATSCFWFSTLVSKQTTLKKIYQTLEKEKASLAKTVEMGQGQKTSRLVAWTFLTKVQQEKWKQFRW